MPGYEVIGYEEEDAIDDIFITSNGVLFRYGFDEKRKYKFRVVDFEKEFAKKFNVKYAQATSSGSSALVTALRALGVREGDEVITQCHTFIATAEAIQEIGAKPVITEIDESLNMDPKSLAKLITSKTKVIIPVHMAGVACDMDLITEIAEDNNIKILEDNAQSPGGTYEGKYLGTIGNAGIFSFDFVKMLTTGEGGMIVTDDEETYKYCRAVTDHGHGYNTSKPRGEDDMICFGFNYKMNEMQGAVGLVQLKKMDKIIKRHRENKKEILEGIKDIPNIELRQIPDPEGDIGDSITLLLPSAVHVDKFVKKWKWGTKNLPDAIKWHAAWDWKHITFTSQSLVSSKNLLYRAVSIPVNMNTDTKQIVKGIKKLMKEIK